VQGGLCMKGRGHNCGIVRYTYYKHTIGCGNNALKVRRARMAVIDPCNFEMIRMISHVCSPKNACLVILCMDTDVGNG
jgi:hypothetical protein